MKDMEKTPALSKEDGRKRIAITGKGGSGKTILAALMTRLLSRNGQLRVLAIDADSTLSLPYTLGVTITKTVEDIRRSMIEDPQARAEMKTRHIREVMAEALQPGDGFMVLAMGRPEGPGCYCAVNDLLRYGIDSLSKDFDITLIDCEAGPEQVNRRVVQGLDVLIIVTDPTVRGIQAARVINQVAQGIDTFETGLVINKVQQDSEPVLHLAGEWGLDILGCVPMDEGVRQLDLTGETVWKLPEDSLSVAAVRRILGKLELDAISHSC